MPLFSTPQLEILLGEDAGDFYRRVGNTERERLSRAHQKLEKARLEKNR